jgi:hypothetical protein
MSRTTMTTTTTMMFLATLAIARPALAAEAAASDDEQPGAYVARQVPAAPPSWWEHPASAATAVRVTGMADVFSGAEYGLEVSHRFDRIFGVDVALGPNDMGYGHRGLFAEALGRAYAFRGPAGISFATGPSVRTANEFGAIAFMRAEIAAELRWAGLPNLLIGVGPEVALNDSGRATCPDNGWFSCFLWKDHWSAGDVGFRVRAAAGWAF